MHLTLRGRHSTAVDIPTTRLTVADRLHLSLEASGWQLSVEVDAQKAGGAFASWGLQATARRSASGAPRWKLHSVPASELIVEAHGTRTELAAFRRGIRRGEPEHSAPWQARYELELGLYHAAAEQLPEFVTVDLGDCALTIDPDAGWLAARVPVDAAEVRSITEQGASLMPVDDTCEEITLNELHVGTLFHVEEDELTTPWHVLAGLDQSLAHPDFYRPFGLTLEVADGAAFLDLVRDSLDGGGADLADLAEQHGEHILAEYMGLSERAAEQLGRTALTLASVAADRLTSAGHVLPDDYEEWGTGVVLTCLVAGSRSARAELVRAGARSEMSEGPDTTELEHLTLATWLLHHALHDAAGDERAVRVWSLPLALAVETESLLLTALRDLGESPHTPVMTSMFASMCTAFDLGVRYQVACLKHPVGGIAGDGGPRPVVVD